MNDRRRFLLTSLAGALAVSLVGEAQRARNVPRIGFLANVRSPGTEAFQKGLRELGYVEGQHIIVEWRFAERRLDRLRELAADPVRLKVDVILAPIPDYLEPARAATSTIPIGRVRRESSAAGGQHHGPGEQAKLRTRWKAA